MRAFLEVRITTPVTEQWLEESGILMPDLGSEGSEVQTKSYDWPRPSQSCSSYLQVRGWGKEIMDMASRYYLLLVANTSLVMPLPIKLRTLVKIRIALNLSLDMCSAYESKGTWCWWDPFQALGWEVVSTSLLIKIYTDPCLFQALFNSDRTQGPTRQCCANTKLHLSPQQALLSHCLSRQQLQCRKKKIPWAHLHLCVTIFRKPRPASSTVVATLTGAWGADHLYLLSGIREQTGSRMDL